MGAGSPTRETPPRGKASNYEWCVKRVLTLATLLLLGVTAMNMKLVKKESWGTSSLFETIFSGVSFSTTTTTSSHASYDVRDLEDVCEPLKLLQHSTEVGELRAMWQAKAPLLVQHYNKTCDPAEAKAMSDFFGRNNIYERDPVILETYFGDLLREMWQLHGTAAFAYWLRYVDEPRIPEQNASIDPSNATTVWDVYSDFSGLGLEVHTVGTWMGKQVAEGRIHTGEDDTFLRDLAMMCALSHVSYISLDETASLEKWEEILALEPFRDEPEKRLVYLSEGQNIDMLHSYIWSGLQFLGNEYKFKEEVEYLGTLCRFAPYNNAFLDCGHGVGHGLYLYLNVSQVPTQVPSLEVLEMQYESLADGNPALPLWDAELDESFLSKMIFGAETAASAFVSSRDDLSLIEYGVNNVYTGFYHFLYMEGQMDVISKYDEISALENPKERELRLGELCDLVYSETGEAECKSTSALSVGWREKMQTFCANTANIYLEALYRSSKEGNSSPVEEELKRMVSSCYYNIGFYSKYLNEEGNITANYKEIREAVTHCSKLGSHTCGRLCGNQACYSSCMDLSAQAVQPLCWRGVGSSLMAVGDGEECDEYSRYDHLQECLALCSGNTCTRSAWEHCAEGFLSTDFILNLGVLFLRKPEIGTALCSLLQDIFLIGWCNRKFHSFMTTDSSRYPQIGTHELEHNLLQNGTKPRMPTGKRSKVRRCLEDGDSHSCQCDNGMQIKIEPSQLS